MTFGDQSASAFLELALRDILAPLCKTKLGAEMLQNNRYVDDGARAHHNRAELYEAMQVMIDTLKVCGFDVKDVVTEDLTWHRLCGELSSDALLMGALRPTRIQRLCSTTAIISRRTLWLLTWILMITIK